MNSIENNSRIGVCKPLGFTATGTACGIKQQGDLDCAVIFSNRECNAAGVFTQNRAQAAPVIVSKKHLASNKAQAVVMTSGNANAATGPIGIEDAEGICQSCGVALSIAPNRVLIAQTGLIGIPLPQGKAQNGVENAVRLLSEDGGLAAAQAIMTTDTQPKLSGSEITTDDGIISFGAMAKGAAMLAPSMATMLACITTDAQITPALLGQALDGAIIDSFNSIIVDGNMSTNDTVFILANGASETPPIENENDPRFAQFCDCLNTICHDLAVQMVRDAEGATKFLTMEVRGAASVGDARKAARAVVQSLLVKCSLAGEDPYWGRVLADLGASGANFDASRVSIYYGQQMLCKNGYAHNHDIAKAKEHMKGQSIHIMADIDAGNCSATAYGCDITYQYLDENMGTS